ncbi:hypothetical protein [Kitasatospora sp. NPDC059327]|uniref:hypothetical protein n=1 Tax=Kitasatospora sp. NPDC059327 TaxID=3346803 RepID=UPI0036C992A3
MRIDGTFWSAVGAIAAAVSAGLAWWAAHKSAAAAADSAQTAKSLAAIEHDRWHRELTPDLRFNLVNRGVDHWLLNVELAGPVGLDRLDSITLTIRGEAGVDHSLRPGDLDPQELADVIWGPLRFQPRVDGVQDPGREAQLVAVDRGEPVRRAMDSTRAPSWFNAQADWQARNAQLPLRLHAVCNREGHQPWIVVAELPVPLSA